MTSPLPPRIQARLRKLEAELPEAKPLLALLEPALAASCDPAWPLDLGEATVEVDGRAPALERRTLRLPSEAAGFVSRIVSAVGGATGHRIDVPRLMEACLSADTTAIASALDLGPGEHGRAGALAQIVPMPWLHAARRRIATQHARDADGRERCPICGAWPVLAALVGIERARWLGCNRCGASWSSLPLECPFCGTRDEGRLGELLPLEHPDARRVDVCRACNGYIKTFSTLGPLRAEEIALEDVATMHLDLAALERGFERPEPSGVRVRVIAEPGA